MVVHDAKAARDRVRLHFEDINGYDADFYADLTLKAAESFLHPLGWDRGRIDQYLRDEEDTRLSSWG